MTEIVTIALILFFGTLCSALAYKLKVSNVFFLVLAGMVFGMFEFVNFDNSIIIVISELALIMVVFDATSRLNFKSVLKYSKDTVSLTMIFLVLAILIIAPLTYYLFGVPILLAILFAILVYGIDPAIALSVLKGKKEKIAEILEIEAIINTPITLILSLIILKFISGEVVAGDQVVMFLQQLFVPIGVGVVLGFVITHIMKHNFFEELSHLMVITAAIVAYVLSELMHGNGVLAVTMFGLIFGNYHIKHKLELEKFASIFANTLKILVFVLLGTVIIKFASVRTFEQLVYGSLLFVIYMIVRYISVHISLKKLSFRHKLFMTLNVPKGIDVGIVILLVISTLSDVAGMEIITNITLLFVLYSIVVSTVSSVFNEWYFEKVKVVKIKKINKKPKRKLK